MTRLLLFGGSGQVGSAIRSLAGADATLDAPPSTRIDLLRPDDVEAYVVDTAPDAIVNAAGYTRVDDAESEPERAFALNAEAPAAIARGAARVGARLVHLSTDYVFDGEGAWPFAPGAPTRPLNRYGASKAAGEFRVLEACAGATVLRTSWVHSGGGRDFVSTAVRLLGERTPMRVVTDQVGAPTRALHLARAVLALATRPLGGRGGVAHFTDAGVASWYDVACAVADVLHREGRAGEGAVVVPVATDDVPRPARRPRMSLLDARATWERIGWTPPHWRVGVEASVRACVHA